MFLYFIPQPAQDSRKRIKDLHLDAILGSHPKEGKILGNGPNGGPGTVYCHSSANEVPRIILAEQTWRSAPKSNGDSAPYWIGFWTERKPTPATLAREKQLQGEKIEMKDGTKWVVPKLLEWKEDIERNLAVYSIAVPQILDIDDNWNLVPSRIDPKYETIWNEGWRAHEAYVGQAIETGRAVMTVLEARTLAAQILGVNYRVSPLEIAVLGLFDEDLAIRVVTSAIDSDMFWSAIKNLSGRSDLETTDSDSGAERPTTEQHTYTPTDQRLAS